jgi:hypothetical protein
MTAAERFAQAWVSRVRCERRPPRLLDLAIVTLGNRRHDVHGVRSEAPSNGAPLTSAAASPVGERHQILQHERLRQRVRRASGKLDQSELRVLLPAVFQLGAPSKKHNGGKSVRTQRPRL